MMTPRKCICETAPMGANGIEGFQIGDICEYLEHGKMISVRIPGQEDDGVVEEWCWMKPRVFKRYFRDTQKI